MSRTVPLSSLVKRVKVGYVGTVDKYYCDASKGIRIYRPTDINPLGFDESKVKYVTYDFHNKNKKSQIHYGDIVISRCGKDGIPVIYKSHEPAQVLNAVIIEPNVNIMTSEEVSVFLKSPYAQTQIINHTSGSVQGVINTEMIAALRVDPEIHYSELARISELIDSKIRNNHSICSTLESMNKLLYDYWFVQFDFPDENGRPYKSSGGKMVWNEELKREIPEGWKSGYFRDMLDIGNGRDHKSLADGNIPVYGSGGLMRKANTSLYTGESVLIPRKGTLNNIMYVNEAFWTVDTMFYTKMKHKNIAKYMYYATKVYDFEKLNTGTGVPSMTTDIIYKLKVLIPAASVLERFDTMLSPMYKAIKQCTEENQQLASLRDFLLPMLMNGQVKVGKAGD